MAKKIDFSRYRVAEAIAERYAANEPAYEIAKDYGFHQRVVELIVAAHDRKGRYEPNGKEEG